MRIRWLVAGFVVAALGAGGSWWGSLLGKRAPVVQPIPFNHQVHVVGQEMQCTDCHSGDKQARSGFADIRSCYECHKDVQGTEPSEASKAAQEKVKEYGKAKKQIPWVTVNTLPGHVYFSHRAHVTFGKIECKQCHGDIGQMTESVSQPSPGLRSMSRCMACHREHGASLQCVACHK